MSTSRSTDHPGRPQGTMTTAVLYAPRDLRIEQRPVPTPSEGEVLVRILSVGVCGSDVHYYEHGRIGDFVVRSPLVLGHESSGQIVKSARESHWREWANVSPSNRASHAVAAINVGAVDTTCVRTSDSMARLPSMALCRNSSLLSRSSPTQCPMKSVTTQLLCLSRFLSVFGQTAKPVPRLGLHC
jgi:hypothetical protein